MTAFSSFRSTNVIICTAAWFCLCRLRKKYLPIARARTTTTAATLMLAIALVLSLDFDDAGLPAVPVNPASVSLFLTAECFNVIATIFSSAPST